MILSATTGSENFPVGSSKFHVFFVPTLAFPGKETHIGQAARNADVPGLRTVGYPQTLLAAPGTRDELGKWTRADYEVPDGCVFKAFGYSKLPQNSRPTSASQLFRARADGPLQRVVFPTLGWSRGQFQSVHVEGRFDLLTVEEAGELGVRIPPMYLPGYQPAQVDRVFRKIVVEAERSAPAAVVRRTVENSDGAEVEVRSRGARRMMDL